MFHQKKNEIKILNKNYNGQVNIDNMNRIIRYDFDEINGVNIVREIMAQYKDCDISKKNSICDTINMWGDINELPTITKYYMYKKQDRKNMSKVNYGIILENMNKESIDNIIDNYRYEVNDDIKNELNEIKGGEINKQKYEFIDNRIIADEIIKEQFLKLYLILKEKKICKPLIKYIINEVSKYEYYKFMIHCGCKRWEILMEKINEENQQKIIKEAIKNDILNVELYKYDKYGIYGNFVDEIKNDPLKIKKMKQTYTNIVALLKGNPLMWMHIGEMTLEVFMYILEETNIHIGHIINRYEIDYMRQAHICERVATRYPDILFLVEKQPELLIMAS
jgi:hypothetical protein